MEQRPLRLGDILDDYCPRERRVTNHAIVALIEADIKQTRCTTCDAEHVYKGGKAPRRKKTETTGALYKEVLAGISDDAGPAASADAAGRSAAHDEEIADEIETPAEPLETRHEIVAMATEPEEEAAQRPDDEPEGPVHRPLIRAQLPRPEGLKVERPLPEFTIRQNNNGRGSNFRGGAGGDMRGKGRNQGGGGAGSNNNGHRFGRGPQRNAGGGGRGGANPGFGRGPGSGGGGQQRSGGPRKRSR